jgi:choice-of-anchor A domain-containing protein
LTLNGNANDQFVFNIYGGMTLGGSSSVILNGGVTATNVVFNFIGAGSSLMTHVGNNVQGIVLAPQRDITFHGLFGEVIGGGKTLTLMSGATVNGFNVPEVTPSSVIFGFLGLVVAFGSRRTLMGRVRAMAKI